MKIGPVKFRRQAEQLWHWLVEQEVVRCRSLPLQKYDYSQPKVILCHLSLTNHVFANWFLFEEDDFDYQPRQMIPKHRLLLLERVNGTAPGQRFSCGFFYRRWKIYWIWWPQKPTPRIWTATDSCNPIRNHNVNRTSKKHTVNNHKRKCFYTALMIPHLILHKASVKCRGGKAQEDSYQAGFKVFLSETITFNTRSMIWWSHQLSVFHVLM